MLGSKKRPRLRDWATVASCAAGLLAMTACSAGTDEAVETGTADAVGAPQETLDFGALHPIGALPESAELVAAKMFVPRTRALGALPASVDLTSKLPPVGDQQTQGSCVGWAVGYAAKTMQEVTEVGWPPLATDHMFSPSWIYNQINGGKDSGSSIATAMQLLIDKGADTMSSFPYDTTNFTRQPDAASNARATHYKALSFNTLGVTAANFKTVLAGGNAIVVGFNVLPDIDALNGAGNTVYDTDAGTRAQRTKTCTNTPASIAACQGTCNGTNKCGTCNTQTGVCTVPACTTAPCSRGGHAVAIVGYDDATQTFKFINSWGKGFNGTGYSAFSYNFIANTNLGLQAFVLTDKANVPGLQDSTMSWLEANSGVLP